MTYFKINLDNIKGAGITHQIQNLFTLIRYCYYQNYKLILPYFVLSGHHNNNKELLTNLTEYIDFDTLIINGKKYNIIIDQNIVNPEEQIVEIKRINSKYGILNDYDLFKDLKWINITYDYTVKILEIGNNISKLLDDYTFIHVRRTDKITNMKINIDTQPSNILTNIRKCQLKNVYIATDEKIDFFSSLKKDTEFNIKFNSDFEILSKIKEQDNYFLFCIENVIKRNAKKRVSTFKVLNKFYNYSLSEQNGWQ